ncbi:hypothetical protein [Labrys wisconsinensis]|uniref:Uncharacterized protein n=1 Tax=Labrys wisconsinensis TaxID=425677 RepID=A0ABU0JEB8_9HYPH|nr:hypothetical protein [Labrys wisconsinensis]MDQ0472611.1 hypothetical protein [Labrys wisconsinensis]
MASPAPQRDADTPNTISALGLRRAALRGMLASPIIDTEEHKSLRDELVGELRSISQSMARIQARNSVELCAKVDALAEEHRQEPDAASIQELVGSIRRDVMTLVPRPGNERPSVHPIRTFQTARTVDPAAAEAARAAAEAGDDKKDGEGA